MSVIEKLEEKFSKFPGIGPRQACRFVHFLLSSPDNVTDELIKNLQELKKQTARCVSCFRFFTKRDENDKDVCPICADAGRDRSLLMVVAKDVDIDPIERVGAYNGLYFVIGGVLPVVDQNPEKKIRIKEFLRTIKKRCSDDGIREVVLALPANPDGDNTTGYLKDKMSSLEDEYSFKISRLGRGLSTGLELEYSDGETIRNALDNRG